MRIFKLTTFVILFFATIGGIYFYSTYHVPPHFRTTQAVPSPYDYLKAAYKGYTRYNTQGLSQLNAVASGYLDFKHFDSLPLDQVIVLNGLAEDVEYIRGKNLKFFCLEEKEGELREINRGAGKNLVCKSRRIFSGVPLALNKSKDLVKMEAALLKERGVPYYSPLPHDWLSNWDFLDQLLALFESVSPNQTLYFHCGHGQGRTTTMLTLWDIYKNAHEVSVEDILSRQVILGGEDLMDVTEWENSTWPAQHLIHRRNLVLAFYKYMTDKDGYGHQPWSEWIWANKLSPEAETFKGYYI